LHTYFVITFHNLVHDLKSNPSWTVPEALAHRQLLFDYFVKRLESTEGRVPRNALLDPSLVLVRSDDEPAWLRAKGAEEGGKPRKGPPHVGEIVSVDAAAELDAFSESRPNSVDSPRPMPAPAGEAPDKGVPPSDLRKGAGNDI
jgi:hypothetical protein